MEVGPSIYCSVEDVIDGLKSKGYFIVVEKVSNQMEVVSPWEEKT